MNTVSVVTAPPKRTVKAMSRAQLRKELEGTGVTTSKSETKEELLAKANELSDLPAKVSDNPFAGEY